MKSAKWLLLLMVLIGLMLFFMRKKPDAAPDLATAPAAEAVSENVAKPVTDAANPDAANPPAAPIANIAKSVSSETDPLEGAHHLQVIVLNLNNQPIEGATIRTAFRGENRRPAHTNLARTFTTSARGMADVLWPTQQIEQLQLLVSKDEYGARKMIWDISAGDRVPANYTVKLRASFHIGGIVVEPEGQPVANATVNLYRFWSGGDPMKNQGEEADFPSQKHTTGADGRWSARNLPTELLNNISITASHSNYLDARVSIAGTPEAEAELRAGTHRLQLGRGSFARGRVVNEDQQPIAGATVWAGRKYSSARKETKTDAQGLFTFMNISTSRVDFTASAEGYAPNFKSHDLSASPAEEIVLQLEKGGIIRGTVRDEAQQPIEDVRVVLEGNPPDPSYDLFEFSTKTDSAGRFEWRAAPNKPMPFYFGKTGYQQQRNVQLKPGEENEVTLLSARKILGQVVDADTDQPVTKFSAACGRSYSEDRIYASSSATKDFRNDQGLFTLEVTEQEANAVQVTADGYADQVQMFSNTNGGDITLLFKLKTVPSLRGVVVTPDGSPVPGASVAIVDQAPGGRSVSYRRGKIQSSGSRAKIATTDAEGRFQISSPPEKGLVLAADGNGYGYATLAAVRTSGVITLEGFGRIDGLLLQGDRPGAGQEVFLTAKDAAINSDFENMKKTTDAQGLFSFENVPSGTFAIVRLIKTSPNSWQHSHSTPVTVQAGTTTDIVLGGADGTVQGQVKFVEPHDEKDLRFVVDLRMVTPKPPDGLTGEQRRDYFKSDEWRELMKQNKNYSGTVDANGALVVDSVGAGRIQPERQSLQTRSGS